MLRRRTATLVAAAAAALDVLACTVPTSSGTAPPPNYPPGAWGASGPPPATAATAPGQPAVGAPTGGGVAPGGVSPAGATDPINRTDIAYLRQRAEALYGELTTALNAGPRSRVTGIPLLFDDTPGDVNAFAACTDTGKSAIAITDGLLEVESQLARCAATDEIFHTNKTDEYIRLIAQRQTAGAPIVRPGPTFFEPTQDHDAAKLARQHQLFEEETGFVLGHEMAHHYLGHLPCTAGNVTASEAGAVLTSIVPAFNQVNEAAADNAGTYNLLDAGKRRSDYHYTENGGLLTMRFFAGMDQLSPVDILFSFERTHPPAQIRAPLIQQYAGTWRATGGAPLIWLM
ncbi:MAG: M48 family metalloprotease [Polyangiaceae bacterium]|nr:M48 family metalloprotease [Polyangiaceae bacterium]